MTYYLHNNGVIKEGTACPGEGVYCKPRAVAVIPIEDREQVERLRDLMDEAWSKQNSDHGFIPITQGKWQRGNALQDALRKYANPTPKIEEPTGLGAVVVDADGLRWTRYDTQGDGQPWCCDGPGPQRPVERRFSWSDINAVRVLSEGVAVDG